MQNFLFSFKPITTLTGKGWAPTLQHTNLYFNQYATTELPETTRAPPTTTTTTTQKPQLLPTKDSQIYTTVRFFFWRSRQCRLFSCFFFLQDAEDSELAGESTESPDESNYMDNEIEDDGERSEKDDLYYEKDECSMQEYEIMKVG